MRVAAKNRFVQDNLNGRVEVEQHEMAILRSRAFTRLNRIQQLGLGGFVFPTATHTRASHAIGVMVLMDRVARRLELDERDRFTLRAAGLLHDIGQYPLSHCIEQVYQLVESLAGEGSQLVLEEEPPPERLLHQVSLRLGRGGRDASDKTLGGHVVEHDAQLLDILTGNWDQEMPTRIAGIIRRDGQETLLFDQLIDSQYDCDRLDYVRRDSHNAGIHYGSVDVDQLISAMQARERGGQSVELLFDAQKGVVALEQYLLARYNIYAQLTFHKTIRSLELMAKAVFKGLIDQGLAPADVQDLQDSVGTERFYLFDDSVFWRGLEQALTLGGECGELAHRLLRREPLVMAYDYRALCKSDGDEALQRLLPASRSMTALEALATQAGVGVDQLVVDSPNPVELTPGMGSDSVQAKQRSPAPTLVNDHNEIYTLDASPDSLLAHLLGMSLHIFRVYVKDRPVADQVRDACSRLERGEWSLPV